MLGYIFINCFTYFLWEYGVIYLSIVGVWGIYLSIVSRISSRGVGCIFFEMACGRPMFPGSSVEEELLLQWKVRLL